jgi:nitrite reductase (NADH) large subunit
MKTSKLVVIGNGMAGVRTLEELLKLAPEHYQITVFGAEPHPNYNRTLLSPVLAGEQSFEEIILNDLAWYADNGIELLLGRKVVKIDHLRRLRPPGNRHRLHAEPPVHPRQSPARRDRLPRYRRRARHD